MKSWSSTCRARCSASRSRSSCGCRTDLRRSRRTSPCTSMATIWRLKRRPTRSSRALQSDPGGGRRQGRADRGAAGAPRAGRSARRSPATASMRDALDVVETVGGKTPARSGRSEAVRSAGAVSGRCAGPGAIRHLRVAGPRGPEGPSLIPLSQIAEITIEDGPGTDQPGQDQSPYQRRGQRARP